MTVNTTSIVCLVKLCKTFLAAADTALALKIVKKGEQDYCRKKNLLNHDYSED